MVNYEKHNHLSEEKYQSLFLVYLSHLGWQKNKNKKVRVGFLKYNHSLKEGSAM